MGNALSRRCFGCAGSIFWQQRTRPLVFGRRLETHKTKRLLPTTFSELITQVTQPPGGSALRVLETYNLPSIKAWARIIDRVGAALVCRDLDQAIDFLSAPCNCLTYRRI
ncbi:hypothetical protein D6C98_04291 [Aureobasidium pullulans]|uniref:Uncharacterized protein n=1 Tax=Aureobasidium pullulans TaxID=5580 RepID=A0A4S9NGC5_AURPU|nr:hypothetical protein D6D24_06459 [Aureobasidium pullulans]THY55127.1 hypothetical protein D6C98_04291 [Aureobasidium pullulans]